MIKLKMSQLATMFTGGGDSPLGRLGRLSTMSAKVTYRAAKMIKAVSAEIESYEKARIDLCKKCGKLDPKTNCYGIDEDKKEEFNKSMNELLQQDVTLDVLEVELDPDAVGLTPSDLIILEPVVKVRE